MTTSSVKRAAIYTRISQADEAVNKPANQEAELRQIAAKHGYEVVAVHTDDDISAYQGKNTRPGFVALMSGISEGRYDVVMATEQERFVRGSASELEALQLVCVRAGAVIHTRSAGIQDPATPTTKALMQIMDVIGGMEIATKIERQKARNRADRAEGKPTSGTRAYGWEKDRMTVRESEAVNVRWAISAVLDEGLSVWAIAQEFNRRGIVTDAMGKQRRNQIEPEKRLVPSVWTTTTVRQLLIRPRNAGILMHEGAEMPNSKIEPLVSREDWVAVCAAVKGTNTLRGPKPQYLLGGILRCTCGATMHATKSVTARKGRIPRAYRIYRCRLYGFDKSQSHVTIQQPIADAVIRDWVVEAIGLGEDKAVTFDRPALAELQARLAEIAAETESATDLLLDGLGDKARIKGRLKVLAAERETIEFERDRILGETAHSAALSTFKDQLDALSKDAPNEAIDSVLEKGYAAWDALTMDAQRAIIRGGYDVTVTPGGKGYDRVKVSPRA